MKTEIVMVLDRSGSMQSISASTIEGLNDFIVGQQKIEGECSFTLRQFDTEHTVTFDSVPINEVPIIDGNIFQPRGMTALYDAICMAIDATGDKLVKIPKSNRPDNVMFVIVTDGYENSSTEFTMEDVNDKIKHQTDKYSWDFIFLGANQDAISTGNSLGILSSKSMTFNASAVGVGNTMSSINAYYSNVRSGTVTVASAGFSDEDRVRATE